jgi:beta-fructofuranosidase
MKKVVFLIFVLITIAKQIGYAQIQNDLIGYWKFDEQNGKVTLDQTSGTSDSIHYIFNKQLPLSDPIRRKGILNRSLEFDGFSSWIERKASFSSTPIKEMSICVWVAPRAFEQGDSGRLSTIVNQQNISNKTGFGLGMFRHGTWSFQVGTGDSWIEIWDEGHPLPRREWSYLVATYEASIGKMTLYMNGDPIFQKVLFKNLPIKPANMPLIIGKNNQAVKTGRSPESLTYNMFNGLMDELKIYNRALSASEVKEAYSNYLTSTGGKIPEISYEEIKIDRAKYKDAPFRPQFHAIPPGHWMNEPHAPYFYNGKYHLTYQHNPTGPFWHQIHWGHWVSDDLVHWKDVPEAIFPENDTIRPDGIWSGSATFDKNGVPVLVYTFGNWSKVRNQGVAFSHPADPSDPFLAKWNAETKPAITQKADQGLTGEFRDPFAWRDKDDGKWYIIVGSGIQNKGGTAWCYVSDDMQNWTLKGPFYLSNYEKYPFLGSIWELPVFLPIGKYENGETKYIFIVSPKGFRQNVEVYYWLGRFDKQNFCFIPDNEEPKYWDYGENHFIGPSGMVDPKTGRVLIFTITAGGRGPGWSGNASLPANIFLDKNGNLGVKPIDELKSLRDKELISISEKNISRVNQELSKIKGDLLEVVVEIDGKKATKYGVKLLKSANDQEGTLIYYDVESKKLKADLSKTSIRNTSFRGSRNSTDTRTDLKGHFDISGETLKLHIFIDKSLIEVYANDRNTITTWAYPSLPDSKGISIWSEGGEVVVKSMKIWELKSIYY